MNSTKRILAVTIILAAITLFVAASGLSGPAADPLGRAELSLRRLENRWGIQVSSVRLSAQGNMVDFRYKVVDPDKAAELGDPEARPVLLDQASGARLLVPKTPKVGPLRQTAQKPEAGKVYFMLFANPGKLVKTGSRVAVAIGDFRVENLTVE